MLETKNSLDLVMMGRIVAPYGVLGWLKIHSDTQEFESLLDYKTWWIGPANGKAADWRELAVMNAKTHNNLLVVKLQGVDDRDAAFACKGKQIAVPRALLPKLAKDEYYWSDLIGLQVTNLDKVDFGSIIDVFATGANDVVVAKNAAGVERLMPYIAQVIISVDLDTKTMLVDWDANF